MIRWCGTGRCTPSLLDSRHEGRGRGKYIAEFSSNAAVKNEEDDEGHEENTTSGAQSDGKVRNQMVVRKRRRDGIRKRWSGG